MKKGLLVLLGMTGMACSSSNQSQQICTLIGCNPGLAVEINGTISGRTTIEVAATGETPRTFECNAGQPCRGFLENFMPSQATVTIRLSDRTVQRTVTPEYRDVRPNGPNCDPVCRQATVQVGL
jgi:hypothetical protein